MIEEIKGSDIRLDRKRTFLCNLESFYQILFLVVTHETSTLYVYTFSEHFLIESCYEWGVKIS